MLRHAKIDGWGVYVLLAAAATCSLLARFHEPLPGDVAVIRWVQTWRRPAVTTLMETVSLMGKSWLLIGLGAIAALGLYLAQRRQEFVAAAGMLGLLVLSPILQLLVDRSRPPADLVGINAPFRGLSFPSGHAYQSFLLFGFLIFLTTVLIDGTWHRRTVQALLVLLILAIGISRVYLGAHWPSDVLGAYLLGGSFLALLLRRYQNW